MAVPMKITAVMPCALVDRYERSEGTGCVHLRGIRFFYQI
jgi:hypothetical protein